jgi:hypothetical protein
VDLPATLAGIIVLVFLFFLGITFTNAFLALPGGAGWAVLFIVVFVGFLAVAVIGIVKSILE